MSLPEQYETTAASEEDLHAEKNYDTREEYGAEIREITVTY